MGDSPHVHSQHPHGVGDSTPTHHPPIAAKIPVKVLEKDGITLYDDYHWFSKKEENQVMKHLEDENVYADAMMEHTRALQDTLYEEFTNRELGDDTSPTLHVESYYYYLRYKQDFQYPLHCRKYESLDNDEQVVLDENEWAEGEDYFSLGAYDLSMDHSLLAFSTDTKGDERFCIMVKDAGSDKVYDEEIENTYFSIRWANDNKTFFYTKLDSVGRSYQLYRHTLGLNKPKGEDDLKVYEEPDVTMVLQVSVTNSKRFILLNIIGIDTQEVLYLDSNDPFGTFKPVVPRKKNVRYTVAHHGGYFYLCTNEDEAPGFKIVIAPISDPANKEKWTEIEAHRPTVYIEKIELFKHHLVIWEWENARQRIRVHNLSDGEVHHVHFSDDLYSLWPGETPDWSDNPCFRNFKTNKLRFCYSSFLQPTIIYDYDMDNFAKHKRKQQAIVGYAPVLYRQERIFAPAPDGALVPISLVYKIELRNEEEGNPMLLMGYLNVHLNHIALVQPCHKPPVFDSQLISLLDRGFVYGVAHVRGDRTMGNYWYEQGRLLSKKNTFKDFIACAEYLIEKKYTTSEKLAIYGRSAGGLLIGAVANLAPQLFKVLVAEVPFVDVINSMSNASVPWTAFEWHEWGNPHDSNYFKYMLEYSPYDNVRAQDYPNMLITTGLNDPRVCYWEPVKWTAKLREKKTDSNLILLKTNFSGHTGSSGRYDVLEEVAFKYAFIIDRLGGPANLRTAPQLIQVVQPTGLSPPDLIQMFHGFEVTMILCTALDLKLFDVLFKLPNQQADVNFLSTALPASLRGTKILLNALVALGLLVKEGDMFTLTAIAATHLVTSEPNYVGNIRHWVTSDYFWNAIRQLPEAVKLGKHIVLDGEAEKPHHEMIEEYARHNFYTIAHVGVKMAGFLASWALRHKPLHVLELGSTSGLLAFSLAHKQPTAWVWSLNMPNVSQVSREYAEQFGVADRTTFLEGDLFASRLGGPYDLIIIGQVFHQLTNEQSVFLLDRVGEVLRPNGRLVFHETVSGLSTNPQPHLSSVMSLVWRDVGESHSLAWYQRILTKAGYGPPTVHQIVGSADAILITSRNLIKVHKKSAWK